MSEKFEAKNIREVCALLATDPDRGLSEKEAAKRHETGGPNELKETKKKSALESFLEQLNDPLIYVLMVAAVISLLLHEISDAAIIAVVVCMNAVVGMIQEGKAQKALDSLKKLTSPRAYCIRDGKDREMVFIASDLKDFKKINDTYGHSTGDYVLKQAVRLMKKTVRSDDSIIRMGGDEFLIVLNNCNPDAAGRIIDNIRRAFKDELVYDREKALYATVNFGISYREHFNGEEAQIRSMYEEADQHMYLDKKRSGL